MPSSVLLKFNSKLNTLSKGKELRDGLSVVVKVGNTLWLTNDETLSLERLSAHMATSPFTDEYGDHAQFALSDFLELPLPPSPNINGKEKIEEADLEGLDFKDGYLWLVGSHSLKRAKPDKEYSNEKNLSRLAKVTADGNRFLLARIPLAEETNTLVKTITEGDKTRTAARLRGDDKGNDLTHHLANDEHLREFLSIPGKDNGFDIEGLAVVGERIFLGLRGPVLRGWAVIIQLELEEQDASTLKLKQIAPDQGFYRTHFLRLDGLGIRELCVQGSDLPILAGPTMGLDGPMTVYRWRGGAQPNADRFVFDDAVEPILHIPVGHGKDAGKDHAEGMTMFSQGDVDPPSILIVYDSTAKERQIGTSNVKADIFRLP